MRKHIYGMTEVTVRRPQRIFGAALLRIMIGASTLLLLIANYSNRGVLWGPEAISSIRNPSLFDLSSSIVFFEAMFHVVLLITAAFTVIGGRMLAACYAVAVWSVHSANPVILDGGNNLVQLIALVLPFLISSGRWSPVAIRTQRHIRQQERLALPWSFALHNVGMAIVLFQTAVVYISAGLWKVAGDAWRAGIALDIVSASPRFGLVGELHALMALAPVVTVLTYATVGVQLAFVPLILSRRASYRVLAVLLVASMHGGIIIVMGLVSFGIAMLGADAAFLTDSDYVREAQHVRRLRDRLLTMVGLGRSVWGTSHPPQTDRRPVGTERLTHTSG